MAPRCRSAIVLGRPWCRRGLESDNLFEDAINCALRQLVEAVIIYKTQCAEDEACRTWVGFIYLGVKAAACLACRKVEGDIGLKDLWRKVALKHGY